MLLIDLQMILARTFFLIGDSESSRDYVEAILGVTSLPYPAVIYSESGLTKCLMEVHNLSLEEAVEWYDYNLIGYMVGMKNPPIIVLDLDCYV